MCFPGGSVVKNLSANVGDTGDPGLIPSQLGRSPGEGKGNPLQYSCLGNPMDRGAWWATVHGVARVGHDLETKPPPPPSKRYYSHLWNSLHALAEKAMATHSSNLAWKIPWTEEPGRLQSMGSLSRTRLSNFTFTFHFHALEKEMATHSSVLA